MTQTRFPLGLAACSRAASRSCLLATAALLFGLLAASGGSGCKVEGGPASTHKDMSMAPDSAASACEAEKCANLDSKCCNNEPCIDVKTNSAHCGECNKLCRTRESCSNGLCVCRGGGRDDICPADSLCCTDGCHAVKTDVNNCGGCGLPCKMGESCVDGTCKCGPAGTTCKSAQVCCGTGCTDMQNDPNNCGKCGRVCPGGMCKSGLCDGECATPCTGTTKCCGGICADILNDPRNCSRCGKDCATVSRWNPPTCLAGFCLGEPGPDMGGMDMSTTD